MAIPDCFISLSGVAVECYLFHGGTSIQRFRLSGPQGTIAGVMGGVYRHVSGSGL